MHGMSRACGSLAHWLADLEGDRLLARLNLDQARYTPVVDSSMLCGVNSVINSNPPRPPALPHPMSGICRIEATTANSW